MTGNFDGIKLRKFGIEIEMTGLIRSQVAKAVGEVLGNKPTHDGGYYNK